MVRAFIAVDIPQEARDALSEVISLLQNQGVSGVRWVRPDAIHLTLKFLGEIDPSLVEGILARMERAVRGTGIIALALGDIGAFPNLNSPRVIWVGLTGELGPLSGLQERIDTEMSLMEGGFPKEDRPFTAHLTLGRLRENVSGEERRRAGKAMAEVTLERRVRWQVKEVNLVRSTLTPTGAVYDVLGSLPL